MKLFFYTHYYDSSNVELIIPTPSIKYKSYYYTNNLIMYNQLIDTSWNRVLDISLNIPYIDPMIYQLYVLEYGLPVDPVIYEQFILRWYKRPKIITQYSILDNPQYYVDVSAADYLCIINYKTYTIDEKYIETFILKYFINSKQYCLLYKRFNNGMEILIKNLKHRDINKNMTFLKLILRNDKNTYIL
jgi:hypothetical protein